MWAIYILLIALCSWRAIAYPLNHGWKPCVEEPILDSQGMLELGSMLYNCSNNIPGNLNPPSYYAPPGTQYEPTNITIQLALNNLITVDDLSSTITIDFYVRLSWKDYRLFMPGIWSYLNPECTKDGVDITYYVRSQDPLNIWLPDIVFTDSIACDVISEVMKLSGNGSLYWSRHMFMTLAQPQMSFAQFPLDSQNFSVRMQSFSFDNKFFKVNFASVPVMLLFDIQQDEFNIKMNELWTFDSTSAYTTDELFPNLINPQRIFNTAYVNILFKRQSLGVIYRLALPVTIFLVIVGLSFWADLSQRIDVTLQMLLVTAAMYIIVGSVIPMVGYLTVLDIFITTVFCILSVTVGIHFLTLVLDRKKFKYPLNSFYRDLLVYVFKAVWIPMAMVIFIVMFKIDTGPFVATLCATAVACGIDAFTHVPYLRRSFKVSVLNLRVKEKKLHEMLLFKINNPDKVLNSTIRETVSDDKEDELNPFGKEIRMTRMERYVLRVTSTYYQDEAVSSVKENKLDVLAESHLRSAAEHQRGHSIYSSNFSEEDDRGSSYAGNGRGAANPVRFSNVGVAKAANTGGATGTNGHSAGGMTSNAVPNPMRVSLSLDVVVDSDDEDGDGRKVSIEMNHISHRGGNNGSSKV